MQIQIIQHLFFSTNFPNAKKNFLNCHYAICKLTENESGEASSHNWNIWLCRLELTLPHCQNIMLSIWKPSWRSLPAASKMVVLAHSRAALIGSSLAVCQTLILSLSLLVLTLITCLPSGVISLTTLRPFKGQSMSQCTYCILWLNGEWVHHWISGGQS